MHPNRSPALNLELVERKIIRVFSIVEKVELFETIQDGLDRVRIGDLQKERSKFAATAGPPGQEDSCLYSAASCGVPPLSQLAAREFRK